MFSLSSTEPTKVAIVYCTLLYFLMLFYYWKKCITYGNLLKGKTSLIFVVLVSLFSITSFYNGDFFHYKSFLDSFDGLGSIGFEDFYQYLILYTDKNYLIFRTVVFGGSIIIAYLVMDLLGVTAVTALFFLFAVFITDFDYSRASLAMSVYYLGLALILIKRNVFLSILGVGIILLSYQFHRSALIMIVMTIAIFVPINRNTIIPLILIYVFGYSYLKEYYYSFINDMIDSEYTDLAIKVEVYANAERNELKGNFLGRFMYIWQFLIYYLIFIYDTKCIFFNKKNQFVVSEIKKLYRVCFALIAFSTFMLFINSGDLSLFYRFLYMTIIPLSVMSTYLFSHQIMSKKAYIIQILFGAVYLSIGFIHKSISF